MTRLTDQLRRLRPLLRVIGVALAVVFALTLPVAIWFGDELADLDVAKVENMLRLSQWAWAAGPALIVADVVLPIPSTMVMAALGLIYGPVVGGALSSAASIMAGTVAYGLARAMGRSLAERLAGRKGLEEASRLFARWGLPLIAASRWFPVLPDTVPFVAGLASMPFPRFLAALSVGSVPLGFVFAAAGHLGRDAPIAIVAVCAFAPAVLLVLFRLIRARRGR